MHNRRYQPRAVRQVRTPSVTSAAGLRRRALPGLLAINASGRKQLRPHGCVGVPLADCFGTWLANRGEDSEQGLLERLQPWGEIQWPRRAKYAMPNS